jgi:hypothetical protein
MRQLIFLTDKNFTTHFNLNLPHLIFNKIVDLKAYIQAYKIGRHIHEKNVMDGRKLRDTNRRIVTDFF